MSLLITNALETRASDIHIEPFENRLIVRYRIDGVLHEVESPPKRLSAAVISRIKIMANLDIAERRLPQDGRIRLRVQGKEIDLRVSTVPTMHGESVVMRILDKGGVALDFARLGFEDDTLKVFLDVLLQPHGILLVTGPTGSGKTTTLYTALDRLNQPDVKILTVEDPVEYQMPGINQIQVKPQIDLTFANALRSIVRQDPDVIMIGEIRDLETAQIAVQAALTGHLVLSTLHTNDAPSHGQPAARHGRRGLPAHVHHRGHPGAAARADAVPAVQGILRRAAGARRPDAPAPLLEGERHHAVARQGLQQLRQTGYIGRISIMEVLPMTDGLRSLIMKHATATDLRAEAVREGMVTMYEDGLRKALKGVTDVRGSAPRDARELTRRMPLYAYRAVSPAGEVSTGELDAANEAEIVDRLRDQGMMPMRIAPATGVGASHRPRPGRARAGAGSPRGASRATTCWRSRASSRRCFARGCRSTAPSQILIDLAPTPPVATLLQGVRDDVRGGKACRRRSTRGARCSRASTSTSCAPARPAARSGSCCSGWPTRWSATRSCARACGPR